MEESHLITILGQQIRLSKDNFIHFTEIISQSELLDLYTYLKIPHLNQKILLILVYYLIKVEKQLEQPPNYHELCCLKLEEHYIKQKMIINIYDYALMCSKLLSKKLIECIHIIYYLIYGRFASKYYVEALMKEKSITNKKVIFPKRRAHSKLYSTNFKTKDQSKKATIVFQNSHTNLELFQQELKSILNITNAHQFQFLKESKEKSKKTTQLKSDYKGEQDEHYPSITQENSDQSKFRTQRDHIVSMKSLPLPSKVHKHENSSIINLIANKSFNNCLKMKQQMRKQKFIEQFNIDKYFRNTSNLVKNDQNQLGSHRVSTVNDENFDGQKEKENKRDIKSSTASNNPKSQKRTFDLFKGIASKIKVMNTNLDQIRNNCIQKKYLHERSIKKEAILIEKSEPVHFVPMKSRININVLECEPAKSSRKVRNSIQIQEIDLGMTLSPMLSKSKSKFSQEQSKLSIRQTSNCLTMNKIAGVPNPVNPQYNPHQSITRKNDSAVRDDEADLMIFGKYNKKPNVKLQQYKEEYRRFIKSQLFDRERINN